MWLHAACTVQDPCALCVLCSVSVGWWLRAQSCGGTKGEAASATQKSQTGSEGCGRWGHLAVYGADVGEFGGTQGGYKACGRLGNPVRLMGYPGKQCDTQRVRTLGRRLGAHPGDWGGLGLGGWWWLWGTHGSCGTPKKGERAETPQGSMGHVRGWENPGIYKAHGG